MKSQALFLYKRWQSLQGKFVVNAEKDETSKALALRWWRVELQLKRLCDMYGIYNPIFTQDTE